jgi:hypothetical protein
MHGYGNAGVLGGSLQDDWALPDWLTGSLSKARGWLAQVLTNSGRALITSRIKGAGASEPLNIGWGTGAGTAAAADTTLFTEVATDGSTTSGTRTAGTSSQQNGTATNGKYRVTGTRTMSATGPVTFTNCGTFDNATIASGSLFLKADHGNVSLSLNDSISYTFDIDFT